ncbi:hypothetical protein JKG47_22640 [Acidithiobacillus sp. MC6.1]|nr:hypothetical protein [Acidithiobacillus sp. MC6.1]
MALRQGDSLGWQLAACFLFSSHPTTTVPSKGRAGGNGPLRGRGWWREEKGGHG